MYVGRGLSFFIYTAPRVNVKPVGNLDYAAAYVVCAVYVIVADGNMADTVTLCGNYIAKLLSRIKVVRRNSAFARVLKRRA